MRPLISLVAALAFDDRGVVLVGHDLGGLAQIVQRHGLELAAQFFGDDGAAGQDGDVLQHGLAAITKTGGLDGQNVEHAAQLVQHQRRQRFAVHVFRNDDEVALALLEQLLHQRHNIGGGADLLVVDQDVRILDDRLPSLRDW